MAEPISIGSRVSELAARLGSATAIEFVPETGPTVSLSWALLDERSTQVARLFAQRGVDESSTVVVALPNVPEHVISVIAAWKLGACVVGLNPRLPTPERDGLLEITNPGLVVANWTDLDPPALGADALSASLDLSAEPLPDRIPDPGYAIPSGGSTGRPKLIVKPVRLAYDLDEFPTGLVGRIGLREGQTQLVAAPLYHNLGFTLLVNGLVAAHRILLMERFDARRVLELVQSERVQFLALVPTMMQRIVRLDDVESYDLSSLETLYHSASRCPAWVKRRMIELVGPEKVFEAFGATEGFGTTEIRGDEWLAHPGSVGRPVNCDLRIVGEDGEELPPGEVGEIYMRPHVQTPTYSYIGAPLVKTTADGFASAGDLGHVDADGYLYPADRRLDLIISGGSNVYPAEVEGALVEHPLVADCVVIGVADEEWGERVHALIQPADPEDPPAVQELDRHVRAHLVSYKAPKSYEFVERLPRNEAGKIRRSTIRAGAGERDPVDG
jgi:bile acid-coenzyme A ligase